MNAALNLACGNLLPGGAGQGYSSPQPKKGGALFDSGIYARMCVYLPAARAMRGGNGEAQAAGAAVLAGGAAGGIGRVRARGGDDVTVTVTGSRVSCTRSVLSPASTAACAGVGSDCGVVPRYIRYCKLCPCDTASGLF